MNRREFVCVSAGACLGFSILPGCGAKEIAADRDGRTLRVAVARIEKAIRRRPGVLVTEGTLPYPVIVVKSKGQWRAFTSKCPHQECRVIPTKGEWLSCTCHNSRFNFDGEVRGGPAPRDLPRYAVEVRDDELVITL